MGQIAATVGKRKRVDDATWALQCCESLHLEGRELLRSFSGQGIMVQGSGLRIEGFLFVCG